METKRLDCLGYVKRTVSENMLKKVCQWNPISKKQKIKWGRLVPQMVLTQCRLRKIYSKLPNY